MFNCVFLMFTSLIFNCSYLVTICISQLEENIEELAGAREKVFCYKLLAFRPLQHVLVIMVISSAIRVCYNMLQK